MTGNSTLRGLLTGPCLRSVLPRASLPAARGKGLQASLCPCRLSPPEGLQESVTRCRLLRLAPGLLPDPFYCLTSFVTSPSLSHQAPALRIPDIRRSLLPGFVTAQRVPSLFLVPPAHAEASITHHFLPDVPVLLQFLSVIPKRLA